MDAAALTNLTPTGRRGRLGLGILAAVVFVVAVIAALVNPEVHALRMWAVIPLFVAALGLFQAQRGT